MSSYTPTIKGHQKPTELIRTKKEEKERAWPENF